MNLIRNIIDKFKWAFEGLFFGLRHDRSIRLQACITLIVIGFSLWLKVETYDLIIIITMCGLVVTTEIINSSIEHLSNYVCNHEYSKEIKRVKDLAAAAVLIASLTAFIVGVIVFYKYIF